MNKPAEVEEVLQE